MKIRWRYIYLSLALTLLLGIAFRFPAVFYTYLILPISGILWFVYRTFLSVNQEVYWVLLILIALIFIFRLIPNRSNRHYRSAYQSVIHEDNRVAYWEGLLIAAEENEDQRLALQHELEALSLSIGFSEGNGKMGIQLPPVRNHFQRRIRATLQTQQKEVHETTDLERYVDSLLKSMENH